MQARTRYTQGRQRSSRGVRIRKESIDSIHRCVQSQLLVEGNVLSKRTAAGFTLAFACSAIGFACCPPFNSQIEIIGTNFAKSTYSRIMPMNVPTVIVISTHVGR